MITITTYFWRCVTISSKELQINEEIRDKEVRVIGSDGSQLGIMPAAKALDLAAEKDLDLVKVPLRLHRLYAKLLTTANISLNKPSERKKQERISTWLILKKSDFL